MRDLQRGTIERRAEQLRCRLDRNRRDRFLLDRRPQALPQRPDAVPRIDRVGFSAAEHSRCLDQQQSRATRHRHRGEIRLAPRKKRLDCRAVRSTGLDLRRDGSGFGLDDRPEQRLFVGEMVIQRATRMYKEKSGKDFNDYSSRQFMGLIVMADAINRAKSTDGEKIRDALAATDMPGEQTIMPWSRVKFDETGQNTFADPVLLQYVGGKFVTIFPTQAAVADAIWPMP